MKAIAVFLLLTGIATAQTNSPVLTPRPASPQVLVPQAAQPLRPADPFAPPPAPPSKPAPPPRVTPPPTARDISANALKPTDQTKTLPPIVAPTVPTTNDVVETLGSEKGVPVTNPPPSRAIPPS